ncbi:HAD-like domain-containing protein [Camillea tinctor]|nr:HAD-like domain-containing protein [Camillea tinctor]
MSIFLDFDGTITTADTVNELAHFALRSQRQAGGPDLEPQWRAIVRAYAADCRALDAAYVPAAPDRRTPEAEIAFLRAAKHVEVASLARVRESAMFRGIAPDALSQAGTEMAVPLRRGFAEFVARRRREGWRVYVVSVNWSAAFIEGACSAGAEGVEIRVLANEVRERDGAVRGPGILSKEGTRNLTNSCDKLEVVRALRGEEDEGNEELRDGAPSIYFGDSTTDLECLLAASRGVVIADGEDSPLLQTLRRIGRDVPHIKEAGVSFNDDDDDDDDDRGRLVWATDFEEVMENMKFRLK